MPTRTVYVTPADEWPPLPHSIWVAGDAEILCGIPPSLADVIPEDHLGLFDITLPNPTPPTPPTVEDLRAQLDDITAQLDALTEES